MVDLKHEIETFNNSATLVTAPRWLASSQSREGETYSLIVISVATREEASTLMRKALQLMVKRQKQNYISQQDPLTSAPTAKDSATILLDTLNL